MGIIIGIICFSFTISNNVIAEENQFIDSDTVLEKGFLEEIDSNCDFNFFSMNTTIKWTVNSKILKRTSNFKKKAGSKIVTNIVINPSKKVRIGIIKDGNKKKYYETTTGGYKEFQIATSGTYCVFVQNMAEDSIKASGYYK